MTNGKIGIAALIFATSMLVAGVTKSYKGASAQVKKAATVKVDNGCKRGSVTCY